MKHIKATFIGKNSLGYEHGQEYILRFYDTVNQKNGVAIEVSRLDSSGLCPYASITSFLENWSNVQNIDVCQGKIELLNRALLEAAEWSNNQTEEERTKMSAKKSQELALKRLLLKYASLTLK